MDEETLEHDMLGEQHRIRANRALVKDKFRQWIEPILVVLVSVLVGLVGWLLLVVLSVQNEQGTSSSERAGGSANICRMLNALGLDVTADPEGRCLDPQVYARWSQYQDERTQSAVTTGEVLDLICLVFANSDIVSTMPPECEGRLTPTGGG